MELIFDNYQDHKYSFDQGPKVTRLEFLVMQAAILLTQLINASRCQPQEHHNQHSWYYIITIIEILVKVWHNTTFTSPHIKHAMLPFLSS